MGMELSSTSLGFASPTMGLVLILPAKIYSVARLTTLASVILTFIGLDSTTPINCQVGFSSLVYLFIRQRLTVYESRLGPLFFP